MIQEIRFKAVETKQGTHVLVLQVRLYEVSDMGYTTSLPTWRDATVEDLLHVAEFIKPCKALELT
jgi:hypothetical protein